MPDSGRKFCAQHRRRRRRRIDTVTRRWVPRRTTENVAVTVGTSIEVVSAIRNQAVELGINSELPDFVLGLYERARKAGLAECDNTCLLEVFRGNA